MTQGILLRVSCNINTNIGLLPKDPKKRINIKQAIDHPWLSSGNVKKVKGVTSRFKDYAILNDKNF